MWPRIKLRNTHFFQKFYFTIKFDTFQSVGNNFQTSKKPSKKVWKKWRTTPGVWAKNQVWRAADLTLQGCKTGCLRGKTGFFLLKPKKKKKKKNEKNVDIPDIPKFLLDIPYGILRPYVSGCGSIALLRWNTALQLMRSFFQWNFWVDVCLKSHVRKERIIFPMPPEWRLLNLRAVGGYFGREVMTTRGSDVVWSADFFGSATGAANRWPEHFRFPALSSFVAKILAPQQSCGCWESFRWSW